MSESIKYFNGITKKEAERRITEMIKSTGK
jgi:hypothetical protein